MSNDKTSNLAAVSAICQPTTIHSISAESALEIAGMLKALADPLRLRMIFAISAAQNSELCVCDLTVLGDVSQPTVSHHLRVLKESGWLVSERRGTWVWYSIAPSKKSVATALLKQFLPSLPTFDLITK